MSTHALFFLFLVTVASGREGFGPGDQDWGFYDVRPGAHMFYWLYHTTARSERPLVIWLQGGPGASGTGYGNFESMGILDPHLNVRNTSWVHEVNMLFIDNPVGTGFSYVDSPSHLTTNNLEIAADLASFTRHFMSEHPQFIHIPLYIFSQSYGGKMAAEFAVALLEDIDAGRVRCNLKGVALGNSWISPVDSTITWAPFLLYTGVVDYEGYHRIDQAAQKAKDAVESGRWYDATTLWAETQYVVMADTYYVDFYNILYEIGASSRSSMPSFIIPGQTRDSSGIVRELMNGPVKEKLGIPDHVRWEGQSNAVFNAQRGDFMKPVTDTVEKLLNETDLDVVVYTGQLDLICDTPGTLDWVQRLHWPGAAGWRNAHRSAFVVKGIVDGYIKKKDHFTFYWINRAGHMVPTDNPYGGLELLRLVTHYDE